MIEQSNLSDFQHLELKDFDCIFVEHQKEMKPLFYIKLDKLLNLFDLYQQKKHKIFDQVIENENEDDIYVLKLNEEGLPFIPIQKDILQQMILEGELIENINSNPDDFVKKQNEKYSYITTEYMQKILPILNQELKKMEFDLQHYKIKQKIKNENQNKNSDTSDFSDSDTSDFSDYSSTSNESK